jgi:hypothetical protein
MKANKNQPYFMIMAWSKKTQKLLHEFDGEALVHRKFCCDPTEADLKSKSFATRLNESKKLGVTDWQPKVQLINGENKFLFRPGERR